MSFLTTISGSIMRSCLKRLLAICFFYSLWIITACGQASTEYQVKAVFLYNFTHFVEWPSTAFEATESPLVIGVLGSDKIEPYLEEAVSGETVNGHPLIVKHFKSIESVKDCHILFIQKPDNGQLSEILGYVKGQDVLTISDEATFTKNGGMIRFYKEENKIRFEINLEAVQASDLQISSKVLRVAKIFQPDKL